MLIIKDGKVIGICDDEAVEIKEEGGVFKDSNQFHMKYETTHCQRKLLKEIEVNQWEGRIIELDGINVKYVKVKNGKCEECPFSEDKHSNWDLTIAACVCKCKAGYRFEVVN